MPFHSLFNVFSDVVLTHLMAVWYKKYMHQLLLTQMWILLLLFRWLFNSPLTHLKNMNTWWRHQMETFSALLAICAGNSPVSGEFPTQRPVMRSFDVFFDLRLNKRLSKQRWCWWFEMLSRPLWRHCNVMNMKIMPQFILMSENE